MIDLQNKNVPLHLGPSYYSITITPHFSQSEVLQALQINDQQQPYLWHCNNMGMHRVADGSKSPNVRDQRGMREPSIRQLQNCQISIYLITVWAGLWEPKQLYNQTMWGTYKTATSIREPALTVHTVVTDTTPNTSRPDQNLYSSSTKRTRNFFWC